MKMPATKMSVSASAKQLQDFNYKYWLTTRRRLVLAVVLTAVALAALFFGAWPQVQQIMELRSDLRTENEQLTRLQNKLNSLTDGETLQLVSQENQINSLLPSKKPLLEMMQSLSLVADETRVSLASIEVAPGEISTGSAEVAAGSSRRRSQTSGNAEPYRDLDLSLVVEGELDQINAFIRQLELTAPITNVTSISLTDRQQNQADDQPFSAEMTITSYYFTQPLAAAIESPLPPLSVEDTEFLNQISSFSFPENDQPTTIRGGGQEDLFNVESLQIQ